MLLMMGEISGSVLYAFRKFSATLTFTLCWVVIKIKLNSFIPQEYRTCVHWNKYIRKIYIIILRYFYFSEK